ncbi:MAG: DNA alkylation repair protein [Spirochaetaceae bacterium]|nr:DNA alkylation repair protein [Spirochaetaceae bacterium]
MTQIQDMLFEKQDLTYKDFHGKLMPTINQNTIIGVRIPIIRKLARELYKTEPELVKVFFKKLPHKYYEENNLHAFLIEQIDDFSECILQTEKFLPYIDNWATCDSLKPKIFKKNLSQVLEFSKKWIKSNHTYTIRFAIGCLMNYFLDDNFSPIFFELVCSTKNQDYYVKMMQAWYFATAIAKQYDYALKIIQEKRLESWTHNKAIQKALESFRVSEEHKILLKNLKI